MMPTDKTWRVVVCGVLALVVMSAQAMQGDGREAADRGAISRPHEHHVHAVHDGHGAGHGERPRPGSATVRLLDRPLLDQHGREQRFASDVVGDRIVAMTFVFTTCTTVCPVVSAIFRQVQEKLDDALGRDVLLVSISVDPTTDTPQRLHEYAALMGARDGWVWLTGERPHVNAVLDGLGAYTPDYTEHPAMVLIGDARTRDWSRHYGFPAAERIIERLEALMAARASGAVTAR